MSIFQIIVALLILALVWVIFQRYILPRVPEPFNTIIIVVLALAAIYWLFNLGGFLSAGLYTPLWRRGP